jgi:uncharacterized repeat protein (TIGR03803 family)
VVFKVDIQGDETVLYSFTGGADGGTPIGGLLRDSEENLYGTTYGGGAVNYGVVFKVSASGEETVLHSFEGGTTDGCAPYGGLVRDGVGNLYGTTDGCGAYGSGTIFRLSKSGTENVLHSFAGSDGTSPISTLLRDKKGNTYGVTLLGGDSDMGVLFKLSRNGKLSVLHSFSGGASDGCYPLGRPSMDRQGSLYGTAQSCGPSNQGVVWKEKKNSETILHNLSGSSSDGAIPLAGVIQDKKGNLYGTTEAGGSLASGTIYQLSKNRRLTLLYSFNGGSDGTYPMAGLIRDPKDNFYGTTSTGGSGGYGTVWQLTP